MRRRERLLFASRRRRRMHVAAMGIATIAVLALCIAKFYWHS